MMKDSSKEGGQIYHIWILEVQSVAAEMSGF